MKNVKRARQALAQDQAAWNSTMHTNKEEGTMPMHLTTLFTLAPAAMDKGDTQEVPCSWLYDNEPVRQVQVPKIQATAQMNAYLSPIPYIAFDEAGLEYYIKKGKVTKAQSNGVAFDPIKEVIALNNTKKEVPIMPAKKTAIVTPQVQPLATMAPLGVTPAPSALDAILAQPIAHIMQQAPVGIPAELLPQAQTKKRLPLPEERSEDTIVQSIAPEFALSASMYKAFIQAFRQALAEEGLVIVPVDTLGPVRKHVEESMPEPVPYDPMADCLAAIAEAAAMNQKPAKPKSTLRIYTQSTPAPKAARQGSGKTDPAIVKAIQQAWKQGGVTQQALADKYGMDSKKVWFFVNRAKQLV